MFASIQLFPRLWRLFESIDGIFARELSDLEQASSAKQLLPLALYMNAHAKLRIAIELAFSICLTEARSILRDSVECAAVGHYMLRVPRSQQVWLNKQEDPGRFQKDFVERRAERLFNGLPALHKDWGHLSEFGSHANVLSMVGKIVPQELLDGSQKLEVNYTGGASEPLAAQSVISLLFVCCRIEELLYADFALRLDLDPTLQGLRREMAQNRELARQWIIERYDIKMPEPKATLVGVRKKRKR